MRGADDRGKHHSKRKVANLKRTIHPAKKEDPAIHDGGVLCINSSAADSTVALAGANKMAGPNPISQEWLSPPVAG